MERLIGQRVKATETLEEVEACFTSMKAPETGQEVSALDENKKVDQLARCLIHSGHVRDAIDSYEKLLDDMANKGPRSRSQKDSAQTPKGKKRTEEPSSSPEDPQLGVLFLPDRRTTVSLRLAVALRLSGRCGDSVRLLNDILDKKPPAPDTDRVIAWLRIGKAFREMNLLDDAERALQEIAAVLQRVPGYKLPFPRQSKIEDLRASIQIRRGRLDLAYQSIRGAFARATEEDLASDDNLSARVHLATREASILMQAVKHAVAGQRPRFVTATVRLSRETRNTIESRLPSLTNIQALQDFMIAEVWFLAGRYKHAAGSYGRGIETMSAYNEAVAVEACRRLILPKMSNSDFESMMSRIIKQEHQWLVRSDSISTARVARVIRKHGYVPGILAEAFPPLAADIQFCLPQMPPRRLPYG